MIENCSKCLNDKKKKDKKELYIMNEQNKIQILTEFGLHDIEKII